MLIALIIILSYLIGSVPFALVVGKWRYGVDIREHGSGNLGGTNTFRTLGVKAGLIVTISDLLKGTLAASLPYFFHVSDQFHPLLAGIPAIIGHSYPIFAKFKGGKSVATSGGTLLCADPIMFIIVILIFFITLYISKYVSLSSMVTGVCGVIYTIFVDDWTLRIFIFLVAIFLIYKHRSNIVRIYNKTEPKVKWL